MWVLTSFGAFMPALRTSKDLAQHPGDPREMQIRARDALHLELLRELYMPDTLGETIRGGGTDYEVRAYCTKQAWADALWLMAMDTDYSSFKATTERFKRTAKKLHAAYLRVWSVLLDGLGSTSPYLARGRRSGTYRRPAGRPSLLEVETTVTRTTTVEATEPRQLTLEDELDVWHEDWASRWATEQDERDRHVEVFAPTRTASGRLDHSGCGHSGTATARKRCRRRFNER